MTLGIRHYKGSGFSQLSSLFQALSLWRAKEKSGARQKKRRVYQILVYRQELFKINFTDLSTKRPASNRHFFCVVKSDITD